MLFAQARGASGGEEVALVVGIVVGIISFAASLAIQILFLLTLKRTLEQCDPRTRTMEPGQVFLNLIPCFGAIWMFFTVSRVSQSLRREYDERGIDVPGDYGQQLGISYASLILAWIIPYVGPLFGIAGVVCWIVYWVRVAELGRTLREGDSFREEQDEYRQRRRREREEDDRERRRRHDENDRPSRRCRSDDNRDDDDDRPSRRRRDY